MLRNITLRKKITKELQLFTDAVENSLNAFDIVSSEGKFLYVNKTYVKMWGYDSAAEIIGTSAASHCKDPELPVRIITELKTKGECNIEFTGLRKDGSTFNVLMWARLGHDPDGNEIYPTTSIDITDRVLAAEEKSRLQEQLELAVKARDEFISICSHELKTPITSMKLLFQLAEKQIQNNNPQVLTEEATTRRVTQVIKQLDRMTMLIDDMLDVSKIASGKLSLNLARLNFQEIVSDVLERFQELFASYNVPVKVSIPIEEFYVFCDRFRMEQVIQNLLTNAIKYGKGNMVKVSVFSEDKKVFFRVEDQGIGIEPENITKIFDRYERVIRASEISGLGLGLYISRQIIELHHGHIHVTSELGKGSVFTVELPIQS